jgi:pyruvate,orthophosphate dikinase
MMDSILNLGFNEETLKALIQATSNERFAYDAYHASFSFWQDCPGVDEAKFDEY